MEKSCARNGGLEFLKPFTSSTTPQTNIILIIDWLFTNVTILHQNVTERKLCESRTFSAGTYAAEGRLETNEKVVNEEDWEGKRAFPRTVPRVTTESRSFGTPFVSRIFRLAPFRLHLNLNFFLPLC